MAGHAVTVLTVLPGGGVPAPAAEPCRMCGIPHGGRCVFLARHLEDMRLRGLSPRTIETRRLTAEMAARALDVPLLDASADDLYAWRAGLRVAPATVRCYVSHLKEIYRWAVREELRPDDPSARLPVPPARRGLPRPVPEAELMAALDIAVQPVRLMIVLGAWCGLRIQEIARLTRACIREHAVPPYLHVERGAAKGGKERIVPLSDFVVAEIAAAGLPRAGLCFPRRDGQRGPMGSDMVSKLIGAVLREAGSTSTPHGLRHRFGTEAYKADHDLLAVRDLMGHADVSTTSIYTGTDRPQAIRAVAAIPVPPRLRVVRAGETA